ncbi:MAG: hypothetical protein ACYDDV_00970 [Methanoregula sp.]
MKANDRVRRVAVQVQAPRLLFALLLVLIPFLCNDTGGGMKLAYPANPAGYEQP